MVFSTLILAKQAKHFLIGQRVTADLDLGSFPVSASSLFARVMPLEQADRELLQRVSASVIVPTSSTALLDEVLEAHPEVEQRTTLYFGMLYQKFRGLSLTHR